MPIMLDIETWSTSLSAAIRSIGAVRFNLDSGPTDDVFYENVSGSTGDMDESTIEWWSRQGDAAQAAFSSPKPIPEPDALRALARWSSGKGNVWANDPDFDVVIVRSAMDRHGIRCPFAYWSHRSVRTALDWGCVSMREYPPAIPHHAAHDAVAQAKAVCAAWRDTR